MSSAPPGQIDKLVNEYGPTGRWADLRLVLDAMDHRRLPIAEQQAWYHARGIVEYQTNNRVRAREIFEEGIHHFPESGWLNFGLGQEYEAQGRIDEMSACFQRVRLADVGSRAILSMARYYYLWDRYDLGQQTIQPIFDHYYELKIVDDTFLYLRGLPGFDESFGYRATFAKLGGRLVDARAELARAKAELHEYPFEHAQLELDATASGEWEPVLADLDAVLPRLDARLPTGRLRMKRAVLRARRAVSVDGALAELNAVGLGANDHRWLEDIRTIARAEAFRRFQKEQAEEEALAAFLARQALLFEPNHAFTFGFIDYQETVKPRFRARRHG